MASPAAENGPNGISTPPQVPAGTQNPSPPIASITQPNTQTSQPDLETNGKLSAASALGATPSLPATSLQDTGTSKRPRDARLIHLILANMGVHAYTERVPLQLLDFAYRYTSGILSDALAYEPPVPQNTHSGKKVKSEDDGISLNALRTAIASRATQHFSAVLPKEFMADVAQDRNKIALPRVDREFGVRLPPERYCFTGVGWGIRESWEDEVDEDEDGDAAMGGLASSTNDAGVGGPVGGATLTTDTMMGGMEEEEDVDEEEFQDAFGGDNSTS